ncbi:hypothetical protein GALL_261000 [mine drainage metagenome]|jgi:hypothetical protein|uniref:Transmembrane protein n=1 Tax=mine drainage metagenome TaxID=410659 RepID=A0A1J5RIM7_9ZZZZ
MSHSGVHAHAPHEQAVEHAAAGSSHSLNQWVAIFTALLAALGALVSYQGSQLIEEVLLHKNEAVLQKAHATDAWNYYQSASTKQHLMELAADLAPPQRQAAIAAKVAKYQQQKLDLKKRAEALEAASVRADRESARLSRPHARVAGSLIALQIAISLASITALTGRRWLFTAALVSAAVGVGVWLTALAALAG